MLQDRTRGPTLATVSVLVVGFALAAVSAFAAGCSSTSGVPLPPGMPQAPCVCTGTSNSCMQTYQNAEICPDLSPIQFCSRDIGSANQIDVFLSNHGLTGLLITSIELLGDQNCAFEPPVISPPLNTVISQTSQEAIRLVYSPKKIAPDYAVLRVQSNAENFMQLDIAVCGQGLPAGTVGSLDGGTCLPCMTPTSLAPACGSAPGVDGGADGGRDGM